MDGQTRNEGLGAAPGQAGRWRRDRHSKPEPPSAHPQTRPLVTSWKPGIASIPSAPSCSPQSPNDFPPSWVLPALAWHLPVTEVLPFSRLASCSGLAPPFPPQPLLPQFFHSAFCPSTVINSHFYKEKQKEALNSWSFPTSVRFSQNN